MHRPHHLHSTGPPLFPLSERLSQTPIYLMTQVLHTSMAYRVAVGSLQPSTKDELRFPHYAALTILDEVGPMSQKELSQRLRFDASDLVTIIDELESAGFVKRERDEKDRRRYQLHVLPSARQKLLERQRDAKIMTEHFFATLSKAEIDHLKEMLQRLDEYHRIHFQENAQKIADSLADTGQK